MFSSREKFFIWLFNFVMGAVKPLRHTFGTLDILCSADNAFSYYPTLIEYKSLLIKQNM